MDLDDERLAWRDEAAVLAQVGRVLFPQETRVQIRLPRELAEAARRAWRRESVVSDPGDETDQERSTRQRAGDLALIGLAIEERGRIEDGEVVVDLDAWQIGSALTAADDAGLLDGLAGPDPR